MESARNTQDTVWCVAGEAQEIYALPGEPLDACRLDSTDWEFACSLAISSEDRRIALVRNGDTNGWLLSGLQATSSMLGHRTRYTGSIREDPSREGIWCLEHVPFQGVPEFSSSEEVFELGGAEPYPEHLPAKIFSEARADLVHVTYSGELYRTPISGVVTDLDLRWVDGTLNVGVCRTVRELSRYLTHGECPCLRVPIDELDMEYERPVPLQRIGTLPLREGLASILARTAPGPHTGWDSGHGAWTVSLRNGIAPALPNERVGRARTDGTPTEPAPGDAVQRGGLSCAVTAYVPGICEAGTPLVWFDVLHKDRIDEVTDFYFRQLVDSVAARPSSVERIHGVDRPVVRVFVDVDDVISQGVRPVLADAFATVDTLGARQPWGPDAASVDEVCVGGASFGAVLAVSSLSLGRSGVRAAIVRSGCYHRGLIAGGVEGRRIDRSQQSSVYRDLSIPWDNDLLRAFPPVLVAHGENDEYYTTGPAQAHGFVERLHEAGVTAWLLELPGEGHTLRSVEGVENLAFHERGWLYLHERRKQPGRPMRGAK